MALKSDTTRPLERAVRLVIAGGGTGGHVFPGVAVAEVMQARVPLEVMWIGTGRLVEKDALAARRWRYRVLAVKPMLGVGGLAALRSMATLPYYVAKACLCLKEFRPDVVLGVGGYVSGPVLVAARLLGIPAALHEQNLVSGLANRIASRFVDVVLLSSERARAFFPRNKVVVTGNPVRMSLFANSRQKDEIVKDGRLRLLVIGGSQGASGLNRLVVSAIGLLSKSGVMLEVVHQSGPADVGMVQTSYEETRVAAKVYPFINDMARAYSWADLVICRAGAGTIAELSALGKPAILIPYPHAAGRHQDANAKALADEGAALYFSEEEIGGVKMASEIQALIEEPTRLKNIGCRAKGLGRPDAADAIVRVLMDMIKTGGMDVSDIELGDMLTHGQK
ncbi:MAG: undecaprenyldiphospho-muramoylpentapeptide beta-N-acetylglucosaminyltransferase [Desulfobacteraceae bacterium]|nr:undecaprenyldiphospho-muramoylpentapeptide beta-N-acetylglucosaminyltransferase [Desulfobacteraceae bacterium]